MNYSSVSYETLLSKIQSRSAEADRFDKMSAQLLDDITTRIRKDLQAPDGVVVISKGEAVDDEKTGQKIPECETKFVVELTVVHAKLSVTVKARRTRERVVFSDAPDSSLEMNLYEVGQENTATWHAINDLAAKVIRMFADEANKFLP
jgi:hypothetical protein